MLSWLAVPLVGEPTRQIGKRVIHESDKTYPKPYVPLLKKFGKNGYFKVRPISLHVESLSRRLDNLAGGDYAVTRKVTWAPRGSVSNPQDRQYKKKPTMICKHV